MIITDERTKGEEDLINAISVNNEQGAYARWKLHKATLMTWRSDSSGGHHRGPGPIRCGVWPSAVSGNNNLGTEVNRAHQRRRRGVRAKLSERVLVQKPEDGMTGDTGTVFHSFLEPREVIVRASESSDTNAGLQKTRGLNP